MSPPSPPTRSAPPVHHAHIEAHHQRRYREALNPSLMKDKLGGSYFQPLSWNLHLKAKMIYWDFKPSNYPAGLGEIQGAYQIKAQLLFWLYCYPQDMLRCQKSMFKPGHLIKVCVYFKTAFYVDEHTCSRIDFL